MGKDLRAVKDFSTEVLHRFVGHIYTYETSEMFLDIGTPEAYARANSVASSATARASAYA